MSNNKYPDFKAGFKYENIGNIVGALNYAKEMKKADGVTVYGWEFLLNCKGFGSINVRIPMIAKAQSSLDNYPVSEKPRVRAGLSRIEQFTTDKGKTYTNATTFVELSPATTVNGDEMNDNIAGRVGGEVFNIQPAQDKGVNFLKLNIVYYPTDKDDKNKRAVKHDGTPVDPHVLAFEVHDPNVINQIQQTVTNGSNIEVGYKYLNKSMVEYDEWGFAISDDNNVIERLEIGKVVVHKGPQAGGQQGFGGGQQGFGGQGQQGFGGGQGNPQGGFGGGQQGGFGNPQGNPQGQGNFGNPNPQGQGGQNPQGYQGGPIDNPDQYQLPNNQYPFDPTYQGGQQGGGFGVGNQQAADPFQGAQDVPYGSPAHQEAQNIFGQGGQQGGFGFGS